MQRISRRAALSTTGHAAVALLAGGGLSVAAADPDIDAALFRKEAELKAEIARKEELQVIAHRLEEEAAAAKPPRPVHPSERKGEPHMPDAVSAAVDELKFKDLANFDQLPADHPYRVWRHEQEAAREACWEAWDVWGKESERLDEENGATAAGREWEAQVAVVYGLADEILKLPAKTLAGIMVKLRLQDDDLLGYEEGMVEILESIDADLRAMAGEPPREVGGDESEELAGV